MNYIFKTVHCMVTLLTENIPTKFKVISIRKTKFNKIHTLLTHIRVYKSVCAIIIGPLQDISSTALVYLLYVYFL